jgi:hypothetical protein
VIAGGIESGALPCGFHPHASNWVRQATNDAARRAAVA